MPGSSARISLGGAQPLVGVGRRHADVDDRRRPACARAPSAAGPQRRRPGRPPRSPPPRAGARALRAAATESSATTTPHGSPNRAGCGAHDGSAGRGSATSNRPSSAATRSASPRRPEPVAGRRRRRRRRRPRPQRSVALRDLHRGLLGPRVLGDVRQRLGDNEVGGGLDAGGRSARPRRSSSTGTGARARAPRAPAPSPRSVSTAGWMPRASSRSSAVACSSSSEASSSSDAASAVTPELRPREPEVEGERDQTLLGAVVEVALDAPSLGVARLDDAGARRAKLLDAGAELGVEPLVLHPERGGRRDRPDEIFRIVQTTAVHDRPDPPPVVGHLGPPARAFTGRELHPGACGVDIALGLGTQYASSTEGSDRASASASRSPERALRRHPVPPRGR